MRFVFKPGLASTLMTLCVVPAFISLGLWQWHRFEVKNHNQMLLSTQKLSAPLDAQSVQAPLPSRITHITPNAAFPQHNRYFSNRSSHLPPAMKHLGYAFQWFMMALTVLGYYVVINTKRRP